MTVFAGAILAGAVALGGCTSSVPSDPNATWGDLWDPSDHRITVTLGLDVGATAPRGFVEAVEEQTDVQLQVVPTGGSTGLAEGADAQSGKDARQSDESAQSARESSQNTEPEETDLFIGLFPEGGVPSDATLLGDEDVCILVDTSWYSANNKTPPKESKSLTDENLMAILKASDPNVEQAAAANMPVWKTKLKQQKEAEAAAQLNADAPDTESPEAGSSEDGASQGETAQSADEKDSFIDIAALPYPAPGKIGSSLEAVRSQNNVGTSVRYQVVQGTCAKASTYLVVAPNAGEAAEGLAAFFTSEDGKALLASYFLTYVEGAPAQKGDAPRRAKDAKAFPPAEVEEALTAWNEVFG